MNEIQQYLNDLKDRIDRVKGLPSVYQNFLLEEISDICVQVINTGIFPTLYNITEMQVKQNPLKYGEDIQSVLKNYIAEGKSQKPQKVFISHSSRDINEINALVSILEDMGFDSTNMFCSSVASYGVPLGEDIYDYLKRQFKNYDLHVIYLLSSNYYESAACLNEMGAAWVLSCSQTAFLLPDFEYRELKGAINPNNIGIKFQRNYSDNELYNIKERVNEFKIKMMAILGNSKTIGQWEKRRDIFIDHMSV